MRSNNLELRMPLPLVDPLTGALIGEALTKLLGVVKIIASSKTWGKELKEKLESIKPTIDQISTNISDTSPGRGNQFKDFQDVLQEGINLVEKLEKVSSFDIYRKYRYGNKIRKFQRKVSDFLLTQVPLNIALDVQKLNADFRVYFERFESEIKRVVAEMTTNPIHNTLMLQQINTIQVCQTSSTDMMHETTAAQEAIICASQVPDMPKFVVGLDNRIKDVKQILLQNDVSVVGVAGMGGSGKTTLVAALCNDTDVKDLFQNNIIFITVSLLDNVNGPLEILEVMWDKLIKRPQRPKFRSIEDAHNQLNEQLKSRTEQPTLVVLDDVWFTSNLESLLFETKGYKTLITTRQDSTIPITDSTRHLYKVEMLDEANALSLFCFWAFRQTSIPTTAKKNLVKEVAAECKGLPLALKVIGSCLHEEPQIVWESAKEKLSRAEHISPIHRDELLNRLEMSIYILDDVQKQCFLDLGAFPEGRKLSVDSLLDIWVYVRGMDWNDAFVVLLELAKRNLINLIGNPGSGAMEYSCASELSFSQHDVMRNLAVHVANKESIDNRQRLFMPRKEDNIPKEWLTLTNQVSGAQFLSIHTGAMQDHDWPEIHFPEVEALALIFSAGQYCLPTFLQTMPKLKVLILYNYSSQRATLSGLPSFPSPVQIRSVLLNKLRVPPLYDNCRSWERLEKLYVCLCEGLENITLLDKEVQALNFPNIKEINIDHCSDLRELPAHLCNLTSLQILSVTNCHLIKKLPEDLGRLRSLRVLRLSTCPFLSRLPPSICSLGKLEYLDISLCGNLKDVPSNFDQLSNLETLNMRECSRLKKLHKVKLKSLKRVIISDPAMEGEWLSIPDLIVEVVVERFSLDWLDE